MGLSRTEHPIARVKCVVNSCTYWDQGNYCQAEAIEIQPNDARSVQETDCATFLSKADN